jgi:hypothetical protein
MNRLNQLPTLRIDPSEKLSLTYRGKTYQGLPETRLRRRFSPTASGSLHAV